MTRSSSITARLGNLLGLGLVVACLLLSLPGVKAVRADDEALPMAGFEDFARDSHPAAAAPQDSPASCEAGSADVTPQSVEQQVQAEVARMRARAAVPPAGGGEVIILNSRGYNYGPAQPGVVAGPGAVAPEAQPVSQESPAPH